MSDSSVQMLETPLTKKIVVKLVQRYGQRSTIPVCDKSQMFAAIANTSTLTPRVVELIKQLGYTVEVVQDLPTEL